MLVVSILIKRLHLVFATQPASFISKVFTRIYRTIQYSTLLSDTLLVFVSRLSTAAAAMLNHFTNPPNDSILTYSLGSDIQITWETDFDRVALTMFHLTRTPYELDFEYIRKSYIFETHTASKIHQQAV